MAGMTKTIYVSQGYKRNLGGIITDIFSTDIHTADFKVSVSGTKPLDETDAGWVAPSVNTQGATAAKRVVKMLIDDSVELGSGLYVWCRVSDTPEIEPLVLYGPFTTA